MVRGHAPGSRTPATAPPGSPLASLTLVKIRCSPKLYMRPNCKGVGFPCSRLDSSLSARPCGLSSSAVHRELSPTASFSRELCAFSRVLRQTSCPLQPRKTLRPPGSQRAPPMGFQVPHRDVSFRRLLMPGDSQLRATVRPRRFARPRRLAPPKALRVCFTPLPRPGFALQGIVPLRGAVPGFPGRFMPSCR